MFDPRLGPILRRAARPPAPAGAAADAALLTRFARDRDPAAFAELVARHGPGVWAVCRRQVRCEADAEDVFQATFLVFAQSAPRVRRAASVGSWLHGVAVRLGRKARAKANRPPPDPARLPLAEPDDPAAGVGWAEVRAALDEELAALPDELRAPLLLCYFRGLTQDEAAAELGWNPRTVKDRVRRGRDRLRARLTRRGIELPAALATPLLTVPLLAVPHVDVGAAPPAAVALARGAGTAAVGRVVAVVAAVLIGGVALGLRGPTPAAATPEQKPPAAPPRGVTTLGTPEFRLTGHPARVFLTADGKTLVSVGTSRDGVRFWDVETGRLARELPLPPANFFEAAYSHGADRLAVIGMWWPDDENTFEAVVWVVDAAARTVSRTLRMPEVRHANEQRVRISADGKRVYTAVHGDLRVWDAATGGELARHQRRDHSSAFAVSPDGKTVVFGLYDLNAWRWEAGGEPKKLLTLGNQSDQIAFAPDGQTLYSLARYTPLLTTWDATTGRQTGSFALDKPARRMALSPDGAFVALTHARNSRRSDQESGVVLWNPQTGRVAGRLPGARPGLDFVSWSKDGSRAAGASSGRAWVWDAKSGAQLGPARPGHDGMVRELAFAPDGTLYTGGEDGVVRAWSAAGVPGRAWEHGSWVLGMALSPDGGVLAAQGPEDSLSVWDVPSGLLRYRLVGRPTLLRFTADGKRLVTWGDNEFLRVWDVRTGKLLAENSTRTAPPPDPDDPFAEPLAARVRHLTEATTLSPDGALLAQSSETSIRILDAATGKELRTLTTGVNGPRVLAFSPDGKRLLLGCSGRSSTTRLPDGRVRGTTAEEYAVLLLDAATGRELWAATGVGRWPGSVAYSPDGSKVAVVSNLNREPSPVLVWDAATGRELGRIKLAHHAVQLAFDAPANRLAVALTDTTVAVYDLEAALKPAK